jgi:hypothetical protein
MRIYFLISDIFLIRNQLALKNYRWCLLNWTCYSALFTNLVGWYAGAASFPLSDVILAQLACPPEWHHVFSLHSGRTNLSLYKYWTCLFKDKLNFLKSTTLFEVLKSVTIKLVSFLTSSQVKEDRLRWLVRNQSLFPKKTACLWLVEILEVLLVNPQRNH